MYNEMIFAGFGGQGIMTIGQIIAYVGMNEGRAVAWIPSYGPEMRGGTANCTVVVTDQDRVGAPMTTQPDWVIAMNNPSFAKFEPKVKPGGLMVYNESLISHKPNRDDIKYIPVKANELAKDLGNERYAAIICMATLVGYTDIINIEMVSEALKKVLPDRYHELIPDNMKAAMSGYEIGKNSRNGK
ncbi:2-oxoacid:acceptor oxidoreductase family protein [bacterium]|nr:2-oxoacid:acceptor oxidoreductase family protein [bacterium]MBU1025346.1 2-oxoacid:acceptor oxidoreductase family protein [bacterium]